jgi:glycosyltransferase involved in cell wall biosynthesis
MDATPLLGERSGVGRYVTGLLGGLAEFEASQLPDETVLTFYSVRGVVPADVRLPLGTRQAPLRVPGRVLHHAWKRMPFPPVEVLTGRVDVFHGTNFVLPPALPTMAGVVTVHDLAFMHHADTTRPEVAAYRRLVPRSVARSACVVVVSRAVQAEVMDEYGLRAEDTVVAHHGVDPAWFEAQPFSSAALERLGLPARYLLFVGNLEPRKNLRTLLDAHGKARAESADVPPLVLVGPAGWGDRWSGAPPDPAHVTLAGFLSDADLRSVVAGATAVCSPSRYEGFDLPLVEALAAGRRVLASDIPVHHEVAAEHATFLPVLDVDAWVHAIARTSDVDSDASIPDSSAVREHVKRFTWRNSALAHLRAYDMALTS